MSLTLSSPAFAAGDPIPRQYSCDGANGAPALEWAGVPDGARTLALIVDDPDAPDPAAPTRTFVHWVVYDLRATTTGLPEGATGDHLPHGARQGRNDANRRDFVGPCPPIGRHRYFFKLYALDVELGDLGSGSKADVERAMHGHVLAHAELMGTYERS